MTGSAVQRKGSVAVDFMTDCDRQPRRPLDVWAADIRRGLQSLRGDQDWNHARVTSASAFMNLAALVVASSGDLPAAERLCRTQLTWLAQLASRSGEVSVLANALQPWINLGRLRVLAGDAEEALPYFRLAECLRDQEPVMLGPCHIEAGMWPVLVAAEPDLPDVLWNVFALDRLKAHLRSGDLARTLSVAAALRNVAPSAAHRYIAEAEIIALIRSGRAEDALQKATQAVHVTASDEIAFLLHQIAAAIVLGRREHARRRAVGLTVFFTQPGLRRAEPANHLRRLKQLALLLEELEEPHYALAVYTQGMKECRRQVDEPLQLDFIDGALRVVPDHHSASQWRGTLKNLLARSLYAEVRRKTGAAAALGHPAIRDLIHAVEAAAAAGGRPRHAPGDDDPPVPSGGTGKPGADRR
ncbi:hypothetical protein ACIRD2_02300 [Streptomyces sp. NPDC093595]|uniref:hypothetical protein n=1 Tax=Streptomyces sp. NPDC093595 TaxID=3366045 RepID=UPI003817182E